ncbi:NAD(+)/NADH kinase [Patescibacteria group bacterium]|nr:NAD(+)/NADH kinase [Patescibacteria group bacterium]MBU1921708.1 NAD(+)/NADH kinase [Patescibacteria group bacterium]
MKKALIFYNPTAGIIAKFKRKKNVVQALQQIGYLSYVVMVQDYFYKKINPPKEDFDLVVAAGGDGTIRLAANYILKNRPELPLAVVPLGSGNLTAESMGIPTKFSKAVENISSGQPVKIDVGLVNEKEYFVLAFSLGHLAESVTRTPTQEKRKIGIWAYFKTFIGRRIKIWGFDFEVDGKKFKVHGNNLFIFNAIRFFGFQPKKKFDFQDGVFDLFITTNRTFFGWFQAFVYLLLYREPRRLVFSTSGKYFKINPTKSGRIRAQIDGDRINLDEVKIRVIPLKLNIILPPTNP